MGTELCENVVILNKLKCIQLNKYINTNGLILHSTLQMPHEYSWGWWMSDRNLRVWTRSVNVKQTDTLWMCVRSSKLKQTDTSECGRGQWMSNGQIPQSDNEVNMPNGQIPQSADEVSECQMGRYLRVKLRPMNVERLTLECGWDWSQASHGSETPLMRNQSPRCGSSCGSQRMCSQQSYQPQSCYKTNCRWKQNQSE